MASRQYKLVFPNAEVYVNSLGWKKAGRRANGGLRCEFSEKDLYYVITARPNGKVISVRVENATDGALVTAARLDIRCQPPKLTVEPRVDRVTLDELVGNLTPGGMVAKPARARRQEDDSSALVTAYANKDKDKN